MCELCNGRHVVYEDMGYGTMIQPCPVCGPKSEEQIKKEEMILQQRLDEARKRQMERVY